jgi:hypothetical protein
MKGVIATLAAVAVIATIMTIGIRTKVPPPDPNWREHIPPPPPPKPRWFVILWWPGRYSLILLAIIAMIAGWTVLGGALIAAHIVLTFGLVAVQIRASLGYRRELKRHEERR